MYRVDSAVWLNDLFVAIAETLGGTGIGSCLADDFQAENDIKPYLPVFRAVIEEVMVEAMDQEAQKRRVNWSGGRH